MSVLKFSINSDNRLARVRGVVNGLNPFSLAVTAVVIWGAVGIELIHAAGIR